MDALNGTSFTSVTLGIADNGSGDYTVGTSDVSMTTLLSTGTGLSAAPMPALGGTLPGVLVGLLGFLGVRRRRAA